MGLWVQLLGAGLIPARAGSTAHSLGPIVEGRAHPRPCGEHRLRLSRQPMCLGSSPPVRGAQHRAQCLPWFVGLIPARAGSTDKYARISETSRAHPRPCGEHKVLGASPLAVEGSSPPVRGAHGTNNPVGHKPGLIPARAGSTSDAPKMHHKIGAHPRPCGEHLRFPPVRRARRGSSPPVRGAPAIGRLHSSWAGLIPARAGSTLSLMGISESCGAHPRPCGEHSSSSTRWVLRSGSSPPVRGAHLLTWGFIPYTGKIGLLWSQSLRPEYTINNCS